MSGCLAGFDCQFLRIPVPILRPEQFDGTWPVIADVFQPRADLVERYDAQTGQEPCAVRDGFLRRIFKIIQMKCKDAPGVELIEFTHQSAAAVKMSCINCQADVVAFHFLDDLKGGARRAHAAPPKAQELERQFDAVLAGNIAQVAQHLDILGHHLGPRQIAVRQGAGNNDNGWAADQPARSCPVHADALEFGRTRSRERR